MRDLFFGNNSSLSRLGATLALLLMVVVWAGCGDVTDRPEDCTEGEYFNEAQKLCVACAAPVEPTCRAGCGFQIVKDESGCAVAECLLECKCPRGEFFSNDSFSCEACDEASDPPQICAAN